MSQSDINLSLLSDEGRESLRRYYELLLKLDQQTDQSTEFDPTEYRGAIKPEKPRRKRLDSLRDEWDRNVR